MVHLTHYWDHTGAENEGIYAPLSVWQSPSKFSHQKNVK